MTIAIGGSSGQAQARPPHGTLWVDVRDYGAKADGGVTDNSVPFQAAVDHLASMIANSTTLGVVYIPSATGLYVLSKSVWVDAPNIEIQGDGYGTYVVMDGTNHQPAFIFGIARVQYGTVNGSQVALTADASYRPDVYQKLDTSVATSPGVRYGLRTRANSFVQFQAGPISSGVSSAKDPNYTDQWGETSKLTVEMCIEPPDGQLLPPNAPILGMGVTLYDPAPFTVSTWNDPNTVMVVFRTSDMPQGNSNTAWRNFSFSLAGAQAPYRIAIQMDLQNAACSAFVNGVQVALGNLYNVSPTSTYPFTPNSGLTFVVNDHYPFMLGATGLYGNYGNPTPIDLRVYGLRLSNTIRYQNNGVGQKQVRADSPGTAVNDAYAYFANDANTICSLMGQDNPATAGRVVSVYHGGAVSGGITSGLLMHSVANQTTFANNAIRNLQLQGSGGFGQTISVGLVYEFTIENVKAFNGFHGVGSFIMGVNYFVYLKRCNLAGNDAGYFGAMQLLDAHDTFFATSGRVTMRHVGCSARWDNVLIAGWSATSECIFKARSMGSGGNYIITNMTVDFEGFTLSRAVIYCEAHLYNPGTSLTLRDIFVGTTGPVPFVMLKDTNSEFPSLHKCWFSAENLQAYVNGYSAAVDVDGPLWHGELKGVALTGPQFNHRQTYGSKTNVLVRDTKFVGPPRQYLWYNGAHSLEVRSPADGQYAEWRCVKTGTYGTPQPPSWYGVNPMSVSPNGLAGYVLNQGYMKATLK